MNLRSDMHSLKVGDTETKWRQDRTCELREVQLEMFQDYPVAYR
jgi:hypothetical protein